MNRELIVKETECKLCTVVDKNLKSVFPAQQFRPHVLSVEPNQEIQIHFRGPFFDDKGNKVYFLAAIDRFSKCPIACFLYVKANGPNVLKFWTCILKIIEFLDLFDWFKQNIWLVIK